VIPAAPNPFFEIAVERFLPSVEKALGSVSDPSARIEALVEPFEQLLRSGFLPPEFTVAEPGRFLQYLVHRPADRAYSLMAMVVAPGVRTPIHDHLAWGLVGVYQGEQQENVYQRIDEGMVDARADLQMIEQKKLTFGEITTLIPPSGDIHQIQTISDGPSVSLHFLGNDIGCQLRHAYDHEAHTVTDFRSGYVNADCDPPRKGS
jgi:predicted metal-dependent enzyme (double-stranded beta helix superfamily)